MAKASLNNKKALSTGKLDTNLRKLVKSYIRSTALCGADTWTLGKVDHNYREIYEIWSWRRMEKYSWTDSVRNEEELHGVKETRNILHTVKRRKVNWTGHTLHRNCHLRQLIQENVDGRIEVRVRRGRRSKLLLDDLREKGGGHCNLKDEALT